MDAAAASAGVRARGVQSRGGSACPRFLRYLPILDRALSTLAPRFTRADVLSEAGHSWVGLDISGSMLEIAVAREVDGDMLMTDMGQGFGFRAAMFDGVVR